MSIFKEINESVREKDPVEKALEEMESGLCSEYMDPSRMDDFATEIANLMQTKHMKYFEAKAAAFDDTEVPEDNGPCCRALNTLVTQKLK